MEHDPGALPHEALHLHDRVALDEIELYTEVLIAVATADEPLSPAEIDRVLGVTRGSGARTGGGSGPLPPEPSPLPAPPRPSSPVPGATTPPTRFGPPWGGSHALPEANLSGQYG